VLLFGFCSSAAAHIFLEHNFTMILGKWPTWRTNSLCVYFYL